MLPKPLGRGLFALHWRFPSTRLRAIQTPPLFWNVCRSLSITLRAARRKRRRRRRRHGTPPLTTVRQPVEEMSREMTKLLLERIAGGGERESLVVPTELVVRVSA
jgi:hypothetical protein